MPELIKALIVILLLSTTVFVFAQRPAYAIIRKEDYSRRRNLWLTITLAAFLAQNIWIYFLIAGALLLFTRTHESNPVASYFFLLFVIPASAIQIPGLGLVNYLFALSHQRLLVLVILLPTFIILAGRKDSLPFGRTLPDKLLATYLALIIILYLRETTLTDTLRQGFYQFIDIFLPYYVVSRSLKNTQDFRDAMLSFVIAVMILALIGTFESVKHWLLYVPLENTFDISSRFSQYGVRAGLLRAGASVGTIPLGYVIAVSIGFYLFLQQSIRSQYTRTAGFLLLITGLLASLSRGPWVGAVFLYLVFIATGRYPVRSLVKLGLIGLIMLPLILLLPGTGKIVDLLPYVGTSSQQINISYRERLLENSLIVINRHPWFGSIDYLETPEMEAMRQGQGIIDIVNTYIRVALEGGYIGVSLFIGFFLTICWGIYKSFNRLVDKSSEEYFLGRSLLASLIGILLIIFTVSSISVIPIVYWSVAGLGAAYVTMMDRLQRASKTQGQLPT